MKKVLIIVAVVVVVALGAFLIFHKSPSNKNGSNTTSQSNVPAVNNAIVVTKTDSTVGQYLADPNGKALYIYNADTSGVSNCTGACLQAWPAYTVTGSTSNLPTGFGTIKRTDNGQTQYTYNGMPLYYFVSDSPGKVTGDGVQNFSVAKPVANPTSNSSNSSQPSTSTQTTPTPQSSNPY